MTSKRHVHDVVVIGGGVAGLSAAQELLRSGCDNICVVEAQNRLGGRVKQVSGIVPWDLDAGAELVHGQDSTVASLLAKDLKADLVKKEYPNYVYWRDSGDIACACGEAEATEDATVDSTFNLIEQLAEVSVDDAPVDTTAEEWFRGRCGAAESKRVMPLLDAFYANDLCSDLRSLGVAEAAWEARHWTDGEDTLVKGGTMAPLTATLSRGVPVRLGWPVREIRWRAQGAAWSGGSGAADAAAEVVGMNGEVLLARAVICAVPLTQLQKQALRLSPAPGETFQRTLQATRVHNALKLWAVFRVPFWETAAPLLAGIAAAASPSEGQTPSALALSVVSSSSSTGSESDEVSPAAPDPARRTKPAPVRSLTAGVSMSRSRRTLHAHSDDSSSSGEEDGDAPGLATPSRCPRACSEDGNASTSSGEGELKSQGPEFWNMLCPECRIPEFWVPRHAPDGLEEVTGVTTVGAAQGSSGAPAVAPLCRESVHVLQGFACAGKADGLAGLGAEAAVQVFLDQLDQIFGASDGKCAQGLDSKPGPATSAFVRGGVMDWAKEPYIEGGYSSPSLGVAAGARTALQALPGGTVFFAGEHTHERLNACLQGAMETGVRAAAQSMRSLGGAREITIESEIDSPACVGTGCAAAVAVV